MKEVILIMVGALLGYLFAGLLLLEKEELRPYEVVDKYDQAGRCYVETWVEVSPEDYIGLDIGDEFTMREK